MECFTIRMFEESARGACPKCGDPAAGPNGLALFADDDDEPICRACGKKMAPSMVALLDLARTAERVGKSYRHLLTPPMESLLDLASAAENYSHSAPKLRAN